MMSSTDSALFGSICFLFMVLMPVIKSDKPCTARDVGGESVVCVCNMTYCDTITRVPLSDNQYVAYTSSKAGSRFKKSFGKSIKSKNVTCPLTLILEPNIQHQTIKGFGAAITDSAAINWMSLPCQLRQHLIDETGIQYNVLRVPIGGTDFSTQKYVYNELPKNDIFLSNFSLSVEDYKYKIPMIKSAFASSKQLIHVLAAAWSGPAWTTEPSNYTKCGRLKTKYYGTFADYHINGKATTVCIQICDNHASIHMEAQSIVTIEFPISRVKRN